MSYSDRDIYPSASAIERLMACSESHAMGLLAKDFGQVPGGDLDEWRGYGTRIHEAIYEQSMTSLTDNKEREAYSKLISKLRGTIGSWGAKNTDIILQEHRMWLHEDLIPVFSGQADYIRIQGERALLLDFKTLWARSAEPSKNHQIGTLGYLICQEFPEVNVVTGQILSPHYTYNKHLWHRDELEDYWEKTIRPVLLKASVHSDPVPGDHCKFCPGMLICPAVKRKKSALAVISPDGELPQVLPTGPLAAELLSSMEVVKKLIAALEVHYKQLLAEDPDAVPGWGLLEGQYKRSITKPKELADALTKLGVDWWPAVSMAVTKTEKLMPKGFSLQSFVEAKQNAPSLGRIKDRITG